MSGDAFPLGSRGDRLIDVQNTPGPVNTDTPGDFPFRRQREELASNKTVGERLAVLEERMRLLLEWIQCHDIGPHGALPLEDE